MKKLGKLVELSGREGGVRRTEALRYLHLRSWEMDTLEEEAVHGGYIKVLRERGPTKPTRIYQWTGKEVVGVESVLSWDVGERVDITEEIRARTERP